MAINIRNKDLGLSPVGTRMLNSDANSVDCIACDVTVLSDGQLRHPNTHRGNPPRRTSCLFSARRTQFLNDQNGRTLADSRLAGLRLATAVSRPWLAP